MSTPTPEHERPWAPAELDALEDRLDARGPEPAWPVELTQASRDRIVERLASYRAIERHAQALLTVDPPADRIAFVLQAARSDAAAPVAMSPPEPVRGPSASWWRRMWFVPALATAGAAALAVVVVMQAPRGSSTASSEPTIASNADARSNAAEPPRPTLAEQGAIASSELRTQQEGSARGTAVVESPIEADGDDGRRARSKTPSAPETPAEEPPPSPDVATTRNVSGGTGGLGGAARGDAPRPASPGAGPSLAKPKSAPAGGAPAAEPKRPAEAEKKDEQQRGQQQEQLPPAERLARADAARRRGDCAAARSDYQQVVAQGTTKQRARARAGLSLCAERDGDAQAASELAAKARQDDPSIDAWIDAQR